MKIVFLGDIMGRSGREVVKKLMPRIKDTYNPNFIIANVDNATNGFGINEHSLKELLGLGIDVLTGGNHIWDQKDIYSFINHDNLLRPANFPSFSPGKGANIFYSKRGDKVLVIHILGQVFMSNSVSCPFEIVNKTLNSYSLDNIDAIVIDFHAESTSEKMAMGHFLDGKVSLVVGTHTHVPTNDLHIMKNGTAYHTDSGMCGDYDSVIGMEKSVPIKGFLNKRKMGRMTPASNEATLCGTFVELNKDGLANRVETIKLCGVLENVGIAKF